MEKFLLGFSKVTIPDILTSCTDGRNKTHYWVRKNDLRENTQMFGGGNVINHPLGKPDKIMFPPLCLMKQFVKALDKNGSCFAFIGGGREYISRIWEKLK